VERKRLDNERDGFIWFCENCGNKLHEEFVFLNDIVAQLPPLFERFYGTEDHRSCDQCGTVMPMQPTDGD
jgi:3-hydroxyanthranilate 3,4-dioxygenase